MNAQPFTDSPEQAAVINAPAGDDVLVVAGAGSGKTYTMTRRIINLIMQGVPPERILGLTFTRKAASELLSRVSAAVLSGRPARDGEGSTRATNHAFLKPEVSTYDAFFQTIVRQYGLLVGFGQDTQPLSEAGAIQLASTVVGRHTDLLAQQDLGSFRTVVSSVLDLSHAIGNAMIGGTTRTVDEAIGRIRAWDTAFIEHLDKAIGDEPVPAEKPKVKKLKRLKKDTDETYAAKRDQHQAELHAVCVYQCAQLRDVTQRRETLLNLVTEYEHEKRVRNMAEFSDFTIAAYQLVSRFPSIGERYRRRYTHVLLDEYQDTSTTQAMLLAALFHPGGRGEEPQKHRNGETDSPRSAVNAVGDPFQSIYAWRGASPGAFRMFQHDFGMPVERKPYPLSVTRRNSRIVLQAANNLTKPLRSKPRRDSSSLMHEVDVSSLSTLGNAPEGTIGVLGFDTFGQEADAVARFARRAISRYGSSAKSDGAHATDTPHVAVLFRGKIRMAAFAQELERRGLKTMVVGYSALLERPEVQDLLSLLHVIADHTDANALMRLLATPRFGLGAKPLTRLASMAEDLDARYRYRALVQTGIIEADSRNASLQDDAGSSHDDCAVSTGNVTSAGNAVQSGDAAQAVPEGAVDAGVFADTRVKQIVKEYRDKVPHAVFLIDMLMRDDLADLLAHRGAFDNQERARIEQAGTVLRQVHAVANHPLGEVVDAAVRALDLDIDTIVAQAINDSHDAVNPARAHSALDSIASLVDTYSREIVEGGTPTLRGFVTWIDSLRQVEEESSAMPDTPADVVLMTVHQSKGLEWDAVAVVSLQNGAFPSNKGGLHLDPDPDHPGGGSGEQWTPPEYQTTVRTWLDDASAVPVPVRVDADILPRFPHDATPGADPVASLQDLDDVVVIDDEVYGDMRNEDDGDDMDAVDRSSWYLTQAEEYGRRLLADERRLAYVALTRAKKDVLFTYSRHATASRDPRTLIGASGKAPNAAKPSVFWTEMQDSLCHEPSLIQANLARENQMQTDHHDETSAAEECLDSIKAPRPDGFFVGADAKDYAESVIEAAWQSPLETISAKTALPWPAALSDDVISRLTGHVASAAGDTDDQGTLYARAKMLVADPDLMPWSFDSETDIDRRARDQGKHLLEHGRQNVTSLQARAGRLTRREARNYWRGLIRPIPKVASPAAEAGTLFHAWAEQFVKAFEVIPEILDSGFTRDSDTMLGGSYGADTEQVTRETLLHDLDDRESRRDALSEKERRLLAWERRLAQSPWAMRRPVWAERQIVVAVPQLGDTIINGKLDAVFFGGIHPEDTTKQYTIVDWKTGARPRKPQDIEHKLIQLDWYRLLLSRIENVPLDRIDATLYYLSEPEEGRRELHARAKTEDEILAELSSGVPEGSDND